MLIYAVFVYFCILFAVIAVAADMASVQINVMICLTVAEHQESVYV